MKSSLILTEQQRKRRDHFTETSIRHFPPIHLLTSINLFAFPCFKRVLLFPLKPSPELSYNRETFVALSFIDTLFADNPFADHLYLYLPKTYIYLYRKPICR